MIEYASGSTFAWLQDIVLDNGHNGAQCIIDNAIFPYIEEVGFAEGSRLEPRMQMQQRASKQSQQDDRRLSTVPRPYLKRENALRCRDQMEKETRQAYFFSRRDIQSSTRNRASRKRKRTQTLRSNRHKRPYPWPSSTHIRQQNLFQSNKSRTSPLIAPV